MERAQNFFSVVAEANDVVFAVYCGRKEREATTGDVMHKEGILELESIHAGEILISKRLFDNEAML